LTKAVVWHAERGRQPLCRDNVDGDRNLPPTAPQHLRFSDLRDRSSFESPTRPFIASQGVNGYDGLLSEGVAKYEHNVISIEHVLPQNPAEGSEWGTDFPDPTEREALVYRLGNLVLLSRKKNSAARNYDFEKKKSRYFATDGKGSPFVLTTQVLGEGSWTADVIRKRQANLLGRLKTLWRL
jgi:hypothetical protein